LNPRLSPEVDAVFHIALAKQPEARFARISAFAEALRQALALPSTGTVTGSTDPTLIGTPPSSISNDVHTSLTLSMEEAQKGTHRVLTLPNGRHISVAVPPDAYNGQVLRLDGLGQPSSSGGPAGALLLKIAITQMETIPVITKREETAPTLAVASPPPLATYVVPPVSPQRHGIPVSVIVLLLVLVLVLGGGGFFYFTKVTSSHINQPNNGTTGSTRNLSSTPPPTATPTNQPTPTATTQSTGGGASNPYTHSGSLMLSDPLTSNNYVWDTGTNNHNASCQFTSQGFEVIQPAQGFFHGCIAKNTNFTNFVYEVQVNMISGDYAGILFCADKTQGTYYYFYIKPDGSYQLQIYSGDQSLSTLTSSSSSAITTGLPSTNLLAVVVQNGNISLYVNETRIATVSDTTYSHGQIGVFTGNDVNSAETIFSNVKVWQL
jgi:hypothetical protein